MSLDVYGEEILEHYHNPRNFGTLEKPDVVARESNPLCGDVVELHLKLENGSVSQVRFRGEGCAISVASASMLTEMVKGKGLHELERMPSSRMLERLGVRLSPTRMKCALLAFSALKAALRTKAGHSF